MLADNEVTHIYELVNARGAQLQVQYVRGLTPESAPLRSRRGTAARTLCGRATGAFKRVRHAPLIVAPTPRHDGPEALRECLEAELAQADQRIVRGWLHAVPVPTALEA